MTRIKLCGMTRHCDIEAANELLPEYIGFVFAKKSRRYIPVETAKTLRQRLDPGILAVGVFAREAPELVAELLINGVIDIAQLHGGEDQTYVKRLRTMTDKPIIQAFRVESANDLELARNSTANYILLDHGSGGTGELFNWSLLRGFERPFFLAGGLSQENVTEAVATLHPFAVDVSSGIETDGVKDCVKMKGFVESVRSASEEEERR